MFEDTDLANSELALGHFCTDGLIYNQPGNDVFTEHQVFVMKKKNVFSQNILTELSILRLLTYIFWFVNGVSVSSISLSSCQISEKNLDLHEWGKEEEPTAATKQ